jgi:hypothetical protein
MLGAEEVTGCPTIEIFLGQTPITTDTDIFEANIYNVFIFLWKSMEKCKVMKKIVYRMILQII